uniref:Uncharacterized protein n=1 Tax=Avena sativa TaxID=4498 RepID=A0ACD5VKN0_AVESA
MKISERICVNHSVSCQIATIDMVEDLFDAILFVPLKLVAGLSHDTNETTLKDAFFQHGDVVEVKVICHPVTGRSEGCGFVKFSSKTEAAALEKMSNEVNCASYIC